MAENVEIARGVVRIDTDVSAVKPAMEGVRDEVNKTTEKLDEAEKQAEKTGNTFTSSFSKATAPLRAFRSVLVGVVGTIGAALAAGVALGRGIIALGEAFKSGAEKARDFKKSLDLSDVAGSIDAIQQRMETLAGELNTARSSGAGATLVLFGKTPAQIESEYDKLNGLLRGLLSSQNAAKQRAREEDTKKAIEEAVKAEEAIQDRVLSIRERARKRIEAEETDAYKREENEAQAALDAIRREYEEATDTRVKYELAKEAEAVQETFRLRVDALRREEQERANVARQSAAAQEQAARDQLDKTARAASEAFSRVQSDIASKLNNVGIERLAGSIETLIQRLGVLAETNRNGQRRL